jgi:hypothetical protein
MNVGMLWFDNDTKAGLTIKVERAAAYYRTKYGRAPTVCFVHPSMLPAGSKTAGEEPTKESEGSSPDSPQPVPENPGLVTAGVVVRANPSVRPNHFWIGVNGVT